MSFHGQASNGAPAGPGDLARHAPRLAAGEARCRALFEAATDEREKLRLGRLHGAWCAALELSPILAEHQKRSI